MVQVLSPDEYGPLHRGGTPRDGTIRWHRVLFTGVTSIVILALAVGTLNLGLLVSGYAGVHRVAINPAESQMSDSLASSTQVDTVDQAEAEQIEPIEESTNILLVGSDSREGLSEDQLAQIGTTDHGSDLTDTVILLQLNPDTQTARMLSFPRDLWVEYCDGSSGRLNGAFARGEQQAEGQGAACLVDTVRTTTGLAVDHFVRLDFAGFVDAVDAVGGVTFAVAEPLQDRYAGLDIPAGCVDFDGVTAIQFVRARHLDSDLGRIARQQRFATEFLSAVTSVGTLTNPVALNALVSSLSDSIQTDEGLGAGDLLAIARTVGSLQADGLDAQTLPVDDSTIAGQQVLVQTDLADAVYAAFADGSTPTATIDQAATDTSTTELPESVADLTVSAPAVPVAPDSQDASEPTAGPAAPSPSFVGADHVDTSC